MSKTLKKTDTIYPEKRIRVMLHALGIANVHNGDYIMPNKRYSPYPTSYRNYYQIQQCDIWDNLVFLGYAKYFESKEDWRCFYCVSDKGKEMLKGIGYKWHEEK